METESNKGGRALIHDGFKYRKYYTTKAGVECCRCTQKPCNARIMSVHNDTTNKQDVITEKNVHNQGEKVDNAEQKGK